MTLLIVIMLIFSILDDIADERDFKISEHNAELRQKELMSEIDRSRTEIKTQRKRVIRRRLLQDSDGTVLAEELIEEDI